MNMLANSNWGLTAPQAQVPVGNPLWTGLPGNVGEVSPANYGFGGFGDGLGIQAPQFNQTQLAASIKKNTNNNQAGGGWFTKDAIIGKDGQQGWGNLALGALQGIGGAYMGMKQYGLAKDALAQSQNQFNLNYNAQRQTTNTQLEDRQRARVAATGGTAESVDSYMARNRIE